MTSSIGFELGKRLKAFWQANARAIGRALLLVLPGIVLAAVFAASGIRGKDFGYHWDEVEWHVNPARKMVQTGLFIPHPTVEAGPFSPRAYVYPTLTKWLILLPSMPAAARALYTGNPLAVQADWLAATNEANYLLAVRSVFIVVSSLTIVWIYGAALALRHTWWQALFAAAGLGLSWEFAYHSRFVVPDPVLTQFSALTLFMLALFHRTARPHWLYAAAGAVGLGTGTKYPGVFLLTPVLLMSVLTLPPRAVWAQARRLFVLCAIAGFVYLLTTPATLLDPFAFFRETTWISNYYAKTPHGHYTVASHFEHFRIVLTYLAFAYFSPYPALAVALFLSVVAGIALWIKRDARFAVVLVSAPVIFFLLFCTKYLLVTVRNYLFVTPFLAIFLARTVQEIEKRVSFRWLRWPLASMLAGVLLVEAVWLVRAGESIRNVDPKTYVRQALDYVRARPNERFRLSQHVLALAKEQRIRLSSNTKTGSDADAVVFFGRAEGPDPWSYDTNDPWLTEAVFGPREVNFNWYSTWSGHDRVVVMTMKKARATGVPFAR